MNPPGVYVGHHYIVKRHRVKPGSRVPTEFRSAILPADTSRRDAMLDRRRFLAVCSGLGFGSTLFPGTLWAIAQGKPAITRDMIEQAAAIAGVAIPDASRQMMLDNLNEQA